MAKSQLFKPPMQWIFTHGGVFPVRRGYAGRGGVPHRERGSSSRGGAIVMYCEGGRSRTAELSEQPKRGIGRLALESGAPGRPRRDPRLLARAQLEARPVPEGATWPTATRSAGTAIEEPTREQQQAVANEIFARVKTLYHGLDG